MGIDRYLLRRPEIHLFCPNPLSLKKSYWHFIFRCCREIIIGLLHLIDTALQIDFIIGSILEFLSFLFIILGRLCIWTSNQHIVKEILRNFQAKYIKIIFVSKLMSCSRTLECLMCSCHIFHVHPFSKSFVEREA